ncbi:MAG: imidazole glycerol phosphate synthase subunit HisH [Moraxellaceae bacterium]|jgi:glutamine amidotransferase|nr:imidazole glycerol phosphate synthase subunit HisH [Moraxellaceae bacterium]HQV42235.1 imidazole glycerol phosphate synthase subunit HisH [Moraxellaceae bacterium]HQX89874.1 imidazole glycerol phosphate synthase subunit HisH [Moraxellaceae bacterium]
MTTVAVLDYGMGNLHSVAKALEHVGATRVEVTNDPVRVRAADRIVLPGQGAMRDCMAEMAHHGVDAEVREIIGTKPLLGICVGMQALLTRSEENNGVNGLDIYPGDVKFFGNDRIENGEKLKVPHMGWNEVWQTQKHPLWNGIADGSRFYFVHSYYCAPTEAELWAGKSHYGLDFCCALARDNIFAVQFHPEKSSTAGLTLLKNFLSWAP